MTRKDRLCLVVAALAALGAASAQAIADDKVTIHAEQSTATLVDMPPPRFPASGYRNGQEAWVRISFLVDASGKAVDPIVANASGGLAFEQAAIDAVSNWEFDIPAKRTRNWVHFRFENESGRDAATSNFMRRYKRIMTHVYREEVADARRQVDQAYSTGGWNLYESAMLWLMMGRVDGLEGKPLGKLDKYQRALAVSTPKILKGADRRDVLSKIVELQYEHGQIGNAGSTLSLLKSEPGAKSELSSLKDIAASIEAQLGDPTPINARAQLFSPCGCESGQALWMTVMTHSAFSVANIDGQIDRFDLRCDNGRRAGALAVGWRYTVDPTWGRCELFLLGDHGTHFDFLEHVP